MLIISDFGTWCCFKFFTSVFLAEWFARCFSLFWRGEFDIKSFIIELILLTPVGVFLCKCILKDLQSVANKTVLNFPSQLGVLKDTFERVLQDTFQIVFQTFLVTVADFFDVGHFVLFLLFPLCKLCTMLQFHIFERTNLQLSWSGVLVSLATQNVERAVTKE